MTKKTRYLFIDAARLLLLVAFVPAFLATKRNFSIPIPFTPAPTTTPAPSPTFEPSSVKTVYYDISGSNATKLRAQLNQLGPVAFDGYKGDAATNWDILWDWPGRGTSQCNLSAAKVSYRIEIILPRWKPGNVRPDLIAKWKDYIGALAEHEQGHVDFVVASHKTVTDAIKGATCDTAEEAGQAVLALIRQYDIDYDASTNHGPRFP